MIHFKQEVRIEYFSDQLTRLFQVTSVWSLRSGIDVEVNSANDGLHSRTSLHPWDLAWDLDTDGDKPGDLWELYQFLLRWLPEPFQVVWEGTHVHVEWDVERRGILLAPPPPGISA